MSNQLLEVKDSFKHFEDFSVEERLTLRTKAMIRQLYLETAADWLGEVSKLNLNKPKRLNKRQLAMLVETAQSVIRELSEGGAQ